MSSTPKTGPINLVINEQRPYPGLAPFTESEARFFFGRSEEARELFRRLRRGVATVLFGASGLGKTSLLQAGLFPLLRDHDFLPVPIRLDLGPDQPRIACQVAEALREAVENAGAELETSCHWPDHDNRVTLWELFHRTTVWGPMSHLLTPILVFDQFEEVFTRVSDHRAAKDLEEELGDLLENRVPVSARSSFPEGIDFNIDNQSFRVVVAIREDFLAPLEELTAEVPSLRPNRMRLGKMRGTQAVRAVQKPSPGLVPDDVAESIVRFVSGQADDQDEDRNAPITRLVVEPALLAVVCLELNSRRLQLERPAITADLLGRSKDRILADFYERCVSDLPREMRKFVEERLLTRSGFRNTVALEDALATEGVTEAHIRRLVERRLLRLENRFGAIRVELTHDVLTRIVRKSRDRRRRQHQLEERLADERRLRLQQREALEKEKSEQRRKTRRLATVAAGLAVFAIVLAAVAAWAILASLTAQRALADAERQKHVAQEQSARTEELVAFLLFEVRDGLLTAGKLDLLETVARTALESTESTPDPTRESTRLRALALSVLGDVARLTGNASGALTHYNESQAICRHLVDEAPDNPIHRHDLALVSSRIGEVEALLGRPEDSRVAILESLRLLSELREENPTDVQVTQALAQTMVSIGSLEELQGAPDSALEQYGRALGLAENALTLDPENPSWQSLKGIALQHRGDALRALDELNDALSAYRDAADISRNLAEQNPADANLRRNLIIDRTRIGEALVLRNNPHSALEQYNAALEEAKRLVSNDARNADSQRVLIFCHQRIGDANRALDRFSAAAQSYARAVASGRDLIDSHPSSRLYKLDLADNLNRASRVLLRLGERTAAVAAWHEALDLLRSLEPMRTDAGILVLGDVFRMTPEEASVFDLAASVRADDPDWLVAARHGGEAYLAMQTDQPRRAISLASEALERLPEHVWINLPLVLGLEHVGERQRAEAITSELRYRSWSDMLTFEQALRRTDIGRTQH